MAKINNLNNLNNDLNTVFAMYWRNNKTSTEVKQVGKIADLNQLLLAELELYNEEYTCYLEREVSLWKAPLYQEIVLYTLDANGSRNIHYSIKWGVYLRMRNSGHSNEDIYEFIIGKNEPKQPKERKPRKKAEKPVIVQANNKAELAQAKNTTNSKTLDIDLESALLEMLGLNNPTVNTVTVTAKPTVTTSTVTVNKKSTVSNSTVEKKPTVKEIATVNTVTVTKSSPQEQSLEDMLLESLGMTTVTVKPNTVEYGSYNVGQKAEKPTVSTSTATVTRYGKKSITVNVPNLVQSAKEASTVPAEAQNYDDMLASMFEEAVEQENSSESWHEYEGECDKCRQLRKVKPYRNPRYLTARATGYKNSIAYLCPDCLTKLNEWNKADGIGELYELDDEPKDAGWTKQIEVALDKDGFAKLDQNGKIIKEVTLFTKDDDIKCSKCEKPTNEGKSFRMDNGIIGIICPSCLEKALESIERAKSIMRARNRKLLEAGLPIQVTDEEIERINTPLLVKGKVRVGNSNTTSGIQMLNNILDGLEASAKRERALANRKVTKQ